jgi:hypothetical protein
VATQDFERPRAKLNVAIFLRLGAVLISPQDKADAGQRQLRVESASSQPYAKRKVLRYYF